MTASPVPRMRAALVTTLRGAAPVIDSFVRYHLAKGFSRLYLYFDDAADPARAQVDALGDPRIAATSAGPDLERQWRDCVQFGYYAPHLGAEVMARQCLNVEVAVQRALDERIDWLLHIDADELFSAPGQDAGIHFARLSASGIERAVYPNLEAFPPAEAIGDFFREVTLFKTNRNLLPGGRLDARQAGLARKVRQIPPNGFLFYSNGKAAARVRPGLVPDGVHRFHETRFPRRGQPPAAGGPAAAERVIGDCRVLHYACCGFDAFVAKYRILGTFADRWFERVDIRDSIGDFHLDARDVVATGDLEMARDFYRQRVMLDDPALIQDLLECGLAQRIDGPARWLNGESPAPD